MADHEGCYAGGVVEIELGQPGLQFPVRGDADDVRILGMQQGLALYGAIHLQLGQFLALEALYQQQVTGRDVPNQYLKSGFASAASLVHQRPAPRRSHQHLRAARMAMAIGVLARLVDLKAVVGVLDQRHPELAFDEERDQLLDQRGLAATRPAGETEDLHAAILPGYDLSSETALIIAYTSTPTPSRNCCRAR